MDRTERVELMTLVMVEDGEGRILMENRQDPDWGGLCFPGGHVEPGESFVRAAVREVQEETGLTVSGLRLCGLKQFPIQNGRYLVLFFKTKTFSGTLHGSPEGPVSWVFREELPQYRLCDKLEEMLSVFDSDSLNEFFWQKEENGWKAELL